MDETESGEVREADGAQNAPEDNGQATDQDIDALLREFEEEDKPPAKPADAKTTDIDPERFTRVEKQMEEYEERERNRAINESLSSAAQSVLSENEALADVFDQDQIEDIIAGRCAKDARWVTAFNNQKSNPEAWGNLMRSLAKDLGKRIEGKVDRSSERHAAESSSRGITNHKPDMPEKNWATASKEEFEAEKRRLFGTAHRSDGLL